MKASKASETRPIANTRTRTRIRTQRSTGDMSGKGWWNTAISGLESRLDTILAEDGTPAKPAKPAAADGAAKPDSVDKVVTAAADKKLAVDTGR